MRRRGNGRSGRRPSRRSRSSMPGRPCGIGSRSRAGRSPTSPITSRPSARTFAPSRPYGAPGSRWPAGRTCWSTTASTRSRSTRPGWAGGTPARSTSRPSPDWPGWSAWCCSTTTPCTATTSSSPCCGGSATSDPTLATSPWPGRGWSSTCRPARRRGNGFHFWNYALVFRRGVSLSSGVPMRWAHLRLDVRPAGGPPTTPPFEQGAVVRTFDTPEFRGITFYEVHARSIINHVPEASRMPFRYTINPYRGCSHGCVYCLGGDTPILMGDGRLEPLADVRPGDEVYGTVRSGDYRWYVKTGVKAQWSTVKPAYRVRLEDGTELVTSGDHRLLSDRGWKYVTGSEQGADRRPHLTLNNKLMGTGQFATGPDKGADYQDGYLCGMIRGDGHLGSYAYARPGHAHGNVHRFRLALVDMEALHRTRGYLLERGVTTREFMFQEAVGGFKPVYAIRTSALAHVSAIKEL